MFQPNDGNFLEDFTPGQILYHPNPTSIDSGVTQAYKSLAFQPFAQYNNDHFGAQVFDMDQDSFVDPAITFQTVFGHSVPDVSFNAVANVGYGRGVFGKPVELFDTIRSQSTVLGVAQHPKQKDRGTVYVRTEGFNNNDKLVLGYNRWVQVHKREASSIIDASFAPSKDIAKPADLTVGELQTTMVPIIKPGAFLTKETGAPWAFEDFEPGMVISASQRHEMTEADHMQFTRLWNNSAKVHYADGKIIYGGYIISLSRNFTGAAGLANGGWLLGINSGAHENPIWAGETAIFQAVVRDAQRIEGRDDIGALRIAYQAAKNYEPGESFPTERGKAFKHGDKGRILDFDVWVAIPTRQSLDI